MKHFLIIPFLIFFTPEIQWKINGNKLLALIPSEWHLFSQNNPDCICQPTNILIDGKEKILTEIEKPVKDSSFLGVSYYFVDSVSYILPIKWETIKIHYQLCNDHQCIQQSITLKNE